MNFDGTATFIINGDVLRTHMMLSLDILKDSYSGPKSIKKYGLFKRKKMKSRDLVSYQVSLLYGFIFQTYLSVTVDTEELLEMLQFCNKHNLKILADSIGNALDIIDEVDDLDQLFIDRINGLSSYVNFMRANQYIDLKTLRVAYDTCDIAIETTDLNSLLIRKKARERK